MTVASDTWRWDGASANRGRPSILGRGSSAIAAAVFVAAWVVTTWAAFAAYALAGDIAPRLFHTPLLSVALDAVLRGLLFGATLGTGQWLLLRRRVVSTRWLVATLAGGLAFGAVRGAFCSYIARELLRAGNWGCGNAFSLTQPQIVLCALIVGLYQCYALAPLGLRALLWIPVPCIALLLATELPADLGAQFPGLGGWLLMAAAVVAGNVLPAAVILKLLSFKRG